MRRKESGMLLRDTMGSLAQVLCHSHRNVNEGFLVCHCQGMGHKASIIGFVLSSHTGKNEDNIPTFGEAPFKFDFIAFFNFL